MRPHVSIFLMNDNLKNYTGTTLCLSKDEIKRVLSALIVHQAILLNLDEFGADCPIFTKDVDEGNEIYIEYKGKEVASYCDDLKFRGRGNDILDEYSVCVTPLYFNDDDCAVEIDIKTSFNGVTKHVCKNISYKLN